MVYIFLADGFEIVEAMAPLDMLKRAKIEVKTVGVTGTRVKASCGVEVTADMEIGEIVLNDDLQAVVLPGGMPGTRNLDGSEQVNAAVRFAFDDGKIVSAICAAPSVLGHMGLLKGKEAICFPGFETELDGATLSKKSVVADGKIITAKGAGVAIEFGLELVKALANEETAKEIRTSIQCS